MGSESRRLGFISVALCLVVLLLGLALLPQQVSFGQGPETPSSSIWQTYSATDPLLIYSNGTWQTAAQPEAQGGVVNSSISPGATLTVTFEGTAVRLFYSVGPEGQTISSQLDDGSVTTVYSYGDSYSYGNVLPYVDLTPGRHVLTVTNGQGTIWIEAVQVKGALLSANATASPQVTSEPTLEAAAATPTPTGPEEVGAFQPQAASALQALADVTVSADNVADLIYEIAHANCANHTIIELVEDGTYSLTSVNNTSSYGANGLPIIQCAITINGNGSIIQRSTSAKFRIFDVRSGGTLTLNNVTIRGGSATATGGSGILSVYGAVHVFDSKIQNNTLSVSTTAQILGAGIYSYYGTLTVDESEISGNSNTCQVGDGGGVGVIAGSAHITNSNIHGNSTIRDGGGVAMLYNSVTTAILNDSEIINNNRIAVFANWGANAKKNWWGSSYGPRVNVYRIITQGVMSASVEVVEPDSVSSTVQYSPFKIAIVPTSPGVTQEALDMQSVAGESGMYLHNGPTLNAKRQPEGVIPWGSKVIALARLEFLQENPPSQVWYEIETSAGEKGWIAVRMEDNFYVTEVSAEDDPSSGQVSGYADITFVYNRYTTASYAVEHSYQNNAASPGTDRVTKRLLSNPFNIPFANFDYTDLAGASESTGSAMFVSESIWMGGMPMTVGDPDSCTAVNYDTAGWRFCWYTGANGGNTSTPWEVHKGLGEYYTNATIPIPSGTNNNTVLVYGEFPNKGEQIMFMGTTVPEHDRLVEADLAPYIGEATDSEEENFDLIGLVEFTRDQLGRDTEEQPILKMGDYLWINSYNPELEHPGSPHGLVILGWAAPQTCASALTLEYEPASFYTTYNDAFADPAVTKVVGPISGGNVAFVVPFVADFTNLQSPIPRPFYCTLYDEEGKENFLYHSWRFYKLSDQITLSESQIYVNSSWNWDSSTGS